ncbi:MAG: ABC transporter permease [Lachnospiraceae bacterium]|nr:ABC transporter permease [Lachnospiraceae bacterium]
MNLKMSLKCNMRTPAKTFITILLLALATFTLLSRITDYVVTYREMGRVTESYHGIIALDNGVPNTLGMPITGEYISSMPGTRGLLGLGEYTSKHAPVPPFPPTPLTIEQMERFAALPNATTETRFMTAGFIGDLRTVDDSYSPFFDWGFDYTSRFVMTGVYTGLADDLNATLNEIIPLYFTNITMLAGDFFYFPEDGETAIIYTYSRQDIVSNNFAYDSDINLFDNENIGQVLTDNLIEGNRYLLIGRYPSDYFYRIALSSTDPEEQERIDSLWDWDGEAENFRDTEKFEYLSDLLIMAKSRPHVILWLGDQDTTNFVFPVIPLESLENDFPESEEYAPLRELIDIINLDPFTYDIVYVNDLFSIPRFNEGNMVIREGRALTPEDADTNVAVVSWYFFETHNLNLGDTLTIELGDRFFPQYASLGATAYVPERHSNFIETTSVEIVGVYLDTDSARDRNTNQFWGYGPNTIFVPKSLLPIEVPADHEIRPGEFSIIIENAKDIDAVLADAEPLADTMGIELRFSDGGWSLVSEGLGTSERIALITVLLNVIGIIFVLLLTVYLFVKQDIKTYAISRALGVTQKDSCKALAVPLGILSIPAILIGGIFGLVYAFNLIETSLSNLTEIAPSSQIGESAVPLGIVLLCLVFLVLFLSLTTGIFLLRMCKTPILALLQGEAPKNKQRGVHNR